MTEKDGETWKFEQRFRYRRVVDLKLPIDLFSGYVGNENT